MKTLILLALACLLVGCDNYVRREHVDFEKRGVVPLRLYPSGYECYDSIYTFKIDGCTYIAMQGKCIIHHAACTNHPAKIEPMPVQKLGPTPERPTEKLATPNFWKGTEVEDILPTFSNGHLITESYTNGHPALLEHINRLWVSNNNWICVFPRTALVITNPAQYLK